MPLVTIRQSFRDPFPRYDDLPKLGDTHIFESRKSNTELPKFSVTVQCSDWVHVGLDELNKAAHELDNECISLPEGAISHRSSGDAARAVAIYLLHPINQALSAIPDFDGSIESQEFINKLRSNTIFNRFRRRTRRSFAVVKFEKRGVIKANEFEQASRTIGQGQGCISRYVQAAMGEDGRSFFKVNSATLMRQAAAYAINYRTQYVALFNWDYLVLIRFSRLNPRLTRQELDDLGVGDYCEIGMIKNDNMGSRNMRAALLGFLAEAYRQTRY